MTLTKDIDFENGVISIQQTLSHDGKKFLTEAKTKSSIRSVILPKDVLKALRKHRALIQQEKLFAEKYTDLDLVVCTSNGTQVNPSNLRRTFIRLQGQAGVTQIRFHDLRHTHATLLMQLGTNPKVVAERLGHSTTRMTLDTYTHYLPTMQEEAVEKLNTLFSDKAVV
ncbi:site-specific integrase [Paenibacillus naphthalenovorans]|uniref:site-specific integrase n=1 Tax=Paenibacillus naphthalenovorans TaxID=162209 RepID=UPI003D266BA4